MKGRERSFRASKDRPDRDRLDPIPSEAGRNPLETDQTTIAIGPPDPANTGISFKTPPRSPPYQGVERGGVLRSPSRSAPARSLARAPDCGHPPTRVWTSGFGLPVVDTHQRGSGLQGRLWTPTNAGPGLRLLVVRLWTPTNMERRSSRPRQCPPGPRFPVVSQLWTRTNTLMATWSSAPVERCLRRRNVHPHRVGGMDSRGRVSRLMSALVRPRHSPTRVFRSTRSVCCSSSDVAPRPERVRCSSDLVWPRSGSHIGSFPVPEPPT